MHACGILVEVIILSALSEISGLVYSLKEASENEAKENYYVIVLCIGGTCVF